jgi:hypothetical protein
VGAPARVDLPACGEPRALAAALERTAGAFLDAHPGLELRLESPRPGLLHLMLLGGPVPHEAHLAVSSADCDELPKTLGLLLGSWLESDRLLA